MFEATLVLVVCSVITVAIATGEALADKATATQLANEMRDVRDMLYAYRDRYQAIPGDDLDAARHVPGAVSAYDARSCGCSGGNAQINEPSGWTGSSIASTNEPGLFWNHVRLAGLAPGDPLTGLAFNGVGGRLGVSSGTKMPIRPGAAAGLYAVCSGKIPGKLARMMDLEMDDGDASTGTVWAAAETGTFPVTVATSTAPYDNLKQFTICMAF